MCKLVKGKVKDEVEIKLVMVVGVFGQAIYLGDKLEHTLIYPNQARYIGIVVDVIYRKIKRGHFQYSSQIPMCVYH